MTERSATEADVEALASRAAGRLEEAGMTVATAESLTGGLLGAALTAVPGVSSCYLGGIVAYATDAKRSLLGVSEQLLRSDGAVAPATAAAMAQGVRGAFTASYGVATTGVAGPERAEGKPAGTVFVAVAGPLRVLTRGHDFEGDRHAVRRRACAAALSLLLEALATNSPGTVDAQRSAAQGGASHGFGPSPAR